MSANDARNSFGEASWEIYKVNEPVTHRKRYGAPLALLLLALFSMLVASCGPEKGGSDNEALRGETILIAQAFEQDRDAGSARNQLQALDVANPMQWLVFTAESAISEGDNPEETRALVDLALSLGSQSHSILVFGMETGILALQDSQVDDAAQSGAAPAAQPSAAPPSTAPTIEVVALSPTDTPVPAVLLQPTAAPTAIPVPQVVASTSMNVRSGPGTSFPVVEDMASGENAEIVARNGSSDWWQIKLNSDQLGWVFSQLVQTSGDTSSIAVAANIPEPPPTPVPAPVAEPTAEPAPPPANDGPDFRLVERRLWDVYENGGRLDGPSVTCGEKRQLVVRVLDAGGSPINGVAVQAEFGAREIFVTGSQGKGDGVSEFILGEGQDVRVIKDTDGREVTSDLAHGMVTKPAGISYQDLISARYCTDDTTCKSFVDAPGCYGHYSWTVTFQRNN